MPSSRFQIVQTTAPHSEGEMACFDDWLSIEGAGDFSSREAIVAWCREHPGASVGWANAVLWCLLAVAIYFG